MLYPIRKMIDDQRPPWREASRRCDLAAVYKASPEPLPHAACDVFGDCPGAFGCSQSCSRTDGWRSAKGPCLSAANLFRVPRDQQRTGSLAELNGTDILGSVNRARNDGRCVISGAHDAARWDADVQVYGRTKRRCYRLHPQLTLAKPITDNLRFAIC